MANQELLLNEIKSLSDSIRKKNQALKLGISVRNKFLEDTFKPIVVPLNQLKDTLTTPTVLNKNEHDAESTEHDTELSSKSTDTIDDEEVEEEEEMDEEDKDEHDEEEEIGTRESPSNISVLSQDVENKGPLTKKYIFAMLHGNRRNKKYHVYGARLENDGLRIGDSDLILSGSDKITIKGQTFKGTSGLFELIFKPIPMKYSKHDLNTFKNICVLTNSHRKGYSPNTPVHRNRSEIYKTVITKLFSEYRGKSKKARGKGMSMKSVYDTNVIYYNNINKLVDRLQLLCESMQAGHSGLDNEKLALTEELKRRGYIV